VATRWSTAEDQLLRQLYADQLPVEQIAGRLARSADAVVARPPRNKGLRYPADPPTVEEIIAVMRAAGDDADAVRLRGLIVVMWRAGLRISEALALNESDLDPSRGAILVRHGVWRRRHKPC
jgi:integrase